MILNGQKILVTGASRGIGKACALKCAEEGARVVLVARDRGKLEEVCGLLPGSGHMIVPADFQNPEESVPDLFAAACADGVKLNGLVHAAGIGISAPVNVTSMNSMMESFSVNYFAFMLMVRQFTRKKYSDGGSIVAISSIAAVAGWKGASVYAGTKGALNASVRALAIELADKKVRVNAVLPSNIKTELLEKMIQVSETIVQDLGKKQPLGIGAPEDVANAVLFLLSPASGFITGSALAVDGGYTAM